MKKNEEVYLPFDRVQRVGEKILRFVSRRTKSVTECYFILRWLCMYLEEVHNCELISPSEDKLRTHVRSLFTDDLGEKVNRYVKRLAERGFCPFDNAPCGLVGSCDDVLSLAVGRDMREGAPCHRAVRKREDKFRFGSR